MLFTQLTTFLDPIVFHLREQISTQEIANYTNIVAADFTFCLIFSLSSSVRLKYNESLNSAKLYTLMYKNYKCFMALEVTLNNADIIIY